MVNYYSNEDLTRKFTILKTKLYDDGFYRDKVVCRNIVSEDVAYDDIFEENVEYITNDIIVNAIVEPGVIFNNFNNQVEVENGDIRLTVRETDASTIENAEAIWIDVAFNNNQPIYKNETTKEFTQGIAYKIKSRKDSVMELDRIYILGLSGALS